MQKKRLRIAVLVMAASSEPSTRNCSAIKDSYIKFAAELDKESQLINDFDFFIYKGGEADHKDDVKLSEHVNLSEMTFNVDDNIYRTFEKTMIMFGAISNKYDLIVRANISTYINILMVDRIASELDDDFIYCNALSTILVPDSKYCNDIYARGDFFIISNKILNGILSCGEKYIESDLDTATRDHMPHIDDVLIGASFIDYCTINKIEYFEHFVMFNYSFMPSYDLTKCKFEPFVAATRLKTIPPTETISGYSWLDNEWRLHDVEKMMFCNDQLHKTDKNLYNELHISDIVQFDKIKTTPIIQTFSVNPLDPAFKDYLRSKPRKI